MNISVPGKLMIAGEWAVLFPGSPCIVAAVNRYVTVGLTIAARDEIASVNLDLKKEKLNFSQAALGVVSDYLGDNKKNSYKISIDSSAFEHKGPNNRRLKLGLGSSAAVVVGLISGVLSFYGYDDTISNFSY